VKSVAHDVKSYGGRADVIGSDPLVSLFYRDATAATLVLVACLIVAAVAPGAVAGGLVTSSTEAVDSAEPIPPRSVPFRRPTATAIASDLRSANGTVKLVVRFAGGTRIGTDDGEVGYSKGSSTLSTNDLKTNAASAQADFESFVEGRSAVTVNKLLLARERDARHGRHRPRPAGSAR